MIDTICWMHGVGVLHRFGMICLARFTQLLTRSISRDMKPENVLLDDNMRIKITDFGTAKILDENDAGEWEPLVLAVAILISIRSWWDIFFRWLAWLYQSRAANFIHMRKKVMT